MTRRPWTPYDPTLPIWRSNLVRDQLQPTWGNLPEFPTCLGRSLWGLQVLSSHYVCSITCSCLSTQPPFVPGCFHNRPSPFGTRPFQWVFRWKVWISEMVDREHLCIFFLFSGTLLSAGVRSEVKLSIDAWCLSVLARLSETLPVWPLDWKKK